MKLEELQEIKQELKRFSDKLEEAIKLAKDMPGWTSYHNGKVTVIGKGDISGTRISGGLKRSALDLKQFLTKKL